MLSSFRSLSKSVVGTFLMIIVLLMIVAGFALQDIGSVFSGNIGMSNSALAKVGDEELTEREVSGAMRRVLNQARQENPEASYSTIADQFDPILESLIDERALLAFAEDHGFVLSKRLIDKEIAEIPQTRGLNGKFSEPAYQAFLQQQQMTDADVRRLIQVGLTQRLALAPTAVDARVPVGVARTYASMLLEARQGQLALVPTEAFRAGLNPSDGDL